LSPLIFNIAMTALDEHVMAPWKEGGTMATDYRRQARRTRGLPNWRIIRYADDFAVLVNGSEQDALALREEIAGVLATMGLRLSQAKTRVVHMSEGFSFLGFRIQWRRKKGTSKHHVYTFIDQRPIRSLKAKIRALTPRTSQQELRSVLTSLNQAMHGWANYFRHAVAKTTFSMLDNFAWWRVIRMLTARHHWRWQDVRRQYTTPTGKWLPISAGGTELRRIAATRVTRYRYRGSTIPGPWTPAETA
jgi:RNA-directed DNA polymerase